jgi:type IV pilus assembly protein PilZ
MISWAFAAQTRRNVIVTELRRHQRAAIDVPVEFIPKSGGERTLGRAKDVSVGGMFIQTDRPLAFSEDLVVHVTLPGQRSPSAFPAVVRWLGGGGMGVQFGLIGARETHAITELVK